MSLLGNAMQQVALSWLVYQSTQSSIVLGLMGFAGGIPAAFGALFAGALLDRANLRNIIISSQALAALQAFALGFLINFSQANMVIVAALVCIAGIAGFDSPIRQVALSQLVTYRSDLRSAIGLNSICYDAARICGPALGAIVLTKYTESCVFLVNGLGHSLAILLFMTLRLNPRTAIAPPQKVFVALLGGMRSAVNPTVAATLLLSACISFAGNAYMVLLPVMAAQILNGGPHLLGALSGAIGGGSVCAGLLLSTQHSNTKLPGLICVGASLFGVGVLVFSISETIMVSILALSVAGLGVTTMMGCCTTLLLVITEVHVQSRIMSLFTLSFVTTAPLGSLATGFLASKISAPWTVTVSATMCLVAAAAFATQVSSINRLLTSCERKA